MRCNKFKRVRYADLRMGTVFWTRKAITKDWALAKRKTPFGNVWADGSNSNWKLEPTNPSYGVRVWVRDWGTK